MKTRRRGKIVATIGPASRDPKMLEELYLSGVDVFRLNFSHGTQSEHEKVFQAIRAVGRKHHGFPTILADLQGPKLRIGVFENDKIILEEGDIFRFDLDPTPGNTKRVQLPHPEIFSVLSKKSLLLADDGKLRFEVISNEEEFVETKVLVGGQLSNRKGVNVPNIILPIPALTEKDKKDLDFALRLGVDWVALSFVQTVDDITQLKKIVGDKARIMAKIEKPLALQAIEPITQVSDGIMVARGDLGVEMNFEEIPRAQRLIIDTCHRLGKPVVVASQMMSSMTVSPNPTRAEVMDVAQAVYSGADAVMLSAESASGRYPLQSVQTMHRIIKRTEADAFHVRTFEDSTRYPMRTCVDAKCKAAKDAAMFSDAKCVVMFSDSFVSVSRFVRLNPTCPILLATGSEEFVRQAGMFSGVFPHIVKKAFDVNKLCEMARDLAMDNSFVKSGETIVMVNDFEGHSVHILQI